MNIPDKIKLKITGAELQELDNFLTLITSQHFNLEESLNNSKICNKIVLIQVNRLHFLVAKKLIPLKNKYTLSIPTETSLSFFEATKPFGYTTLNPLLKVIVNKINTQIHKEVLV